MAELDGFSSVRSRAYGVALAMSALSRVGDRERTPGFWDRAGCPSLVSRGHDKEAQMQRKMFDCRDLPGECTLAIQGEQHEVVEAQVLHSVQLHGQNDSAELRDLIRARSKMPPAHA